VSPRLLVLQHQDTCPPGWFGEWLAAAGVELDLLPAHQGQAIPAALVDHAGLLVLGGRMGATDDADVRWLAPVRALIATVVAAGDPFLGICLGHQLTAAALGGTVSPNPHGHGRGLTPYAPTPAAAQDPLLSAVAPGALAVQWNNDVVVRLPRAAQPLATSPDGTVQAARFGPLAWGVQFHPEASPQIFRGWTVDDPALDHDQLSGIDLPHTVEQVTGHESQLRRDWEPLARRFAELLSG
jgi:GMP synthase (glutamine-hydrolysing)